jgi:hypothetical protein
MVGRRLLRPWPLLRILARARRTCAVDRTKTTLTHQLFANLYSRNRSAAEMIKDAGNSKNNPQPPALFLMATGYWLSQAIYVAAKLGLAELIEGWSQVVFCTRRGNWSRQAIAVSTHACTVECGGVCSHKTTTLRYPELGKACKAMSRVP